MKTTSSLRIRATRFGAFALTAATIISLSSCRDKAEVANNANQTTAAAGDPVPGDWVFIHELSDAESLNLITANDATSQEVHALMYETLTTTDPFSLETIPVLADSLPVMSADKLSYEYRIRKDAKFTDGKPITANDIIFYLKLIKNPMIPKAAPLRGYYSRVQRLELVDNDPYRLRAVMSEPYYLAEQFIGGLYAFPQHVWDPQGLSNKITFEDLNAAKETPEISQIAEIINDVERGFDKKYLVASGPYMFEEHRRNDRLVLARNPNYWNAADKYGKAYPDRIVYRTINDPTSATAALKTGDVDYQPVMEKVTFNNERKRFADNNLKEAVYDYPQYTYIGYHQRRPMFQDKRVRLAMSHVVDRDALIKMVYFNMARPVQSPIFYKRPEYDSTLPLIKFDLAKAKQLLAEAGWTDSDGNGILDKVIDGKKTDFQFNILLNSGNERRKQTALVMVDALKQVGINAKTTSLEWATFLERIRKGDYDAYVGGWAMNVVEGDMYQIWHSKSAEEGGSNYIQYKSPELDKVIETIRSEFDYNKRLALYKQAQQIINEDQPYTFLVSEQQTGAYHNRFQNVQFFAPRPCYNPGWWWVPEQAQKYKTPKQVAAK